MPSKPLLLILLLCIRAGADTWALLVAGSNTWENYRHQANVAHAFHTLKGRGINPENMVTIMFDDIANNTENPFPGTIYNRATGKKAGFNLNSGLQKDYTGAEVTAENIEHAMTCNGGQKSNSTSNAAMPCLKSTASDTVFIYWAGHGSDGELLLPNGNGPSMKSAQLLQALQKMHTNNQYSKLLFYIEACDSGSMFDGQADALTSIDALAVTAARPDENSYPVYCCDYFRPPSCTVDGQDVGACLGDMFSVAWLQDSDKRVATETVQQQVAVATSGAASVGGNPGSHVMTYGATALLAETIATFQGRGGTLGSRGFDVAKQHNLNHSRITTTTPWYLKSIVGV